MTRKEEKVGDYFRIKGPVDLFLFSAFSLKLQLSHPASLFLFHPSISSSKLSQFCTFSLPFDSPRNPIPLCPFLCSASFFKIASLQLFLGIRATLNP